MKQKFKKFTKEERKALGLDDMPASKYPERPAAMTPRYVDGEARFMGDIDGKPTTLDFER